MKLQDELRELRMLWSAYWPSRILLTANNLRIFEYLKSPKTVGELVSIIKTDLRATEILLDALTSFKLLKKSSKKYQNALRANRFLTIDSPYYHGNIIKHLDIIWDNWSELDLVIKTGKPVKKHYEHESFIKGMHDISKLKASKVIKLMGLRGVKRALDLGGGPGTYAIEMAKRGVHVTIFDLPETIEIAQDIIKKEPLREENLIDFIPGDVLKDDIGSNYDLIFISQLLHAFSYEDNAKIIKKSAEALNQKGRIVVQEFYIDNSHANPVRSAIFSVNMLIQTEGGRCYSPAEIKKWLIQAGLKRFSEKYFDDCLILSSGF